MKKGWKIIVALSFLTFLGGCSCSKKTYPTTKDTTKDTTEQTETKQTTPSIDDIYTLTIQNANPDMGTFNDVSGDYDNGTIISLSATPNLGIVFDGWYDGTTCISSTSTFSYTMPTKNTTLTCKFKSNPELSNYVYTVEGDDLILTSVKNKNITSLTIPSCVTKMEEGCLKGCSSLVELTIPYTGCEKGKTKDDLHQYPIGYLFGEEEYDGSTKTSQYFYNDSSSTMSFVDYYIPSSLKKVTIEEGAVLTGTFYNCLNIEEINLLEGVNRIEYRGIMRCGIKEMELSDNITYLGAYSFGSCPDLKTIKFPNTITKILTNTVGTCPNLENVYIPEMITSIEGYAFIECTKLKNIYYDGTLASWLNISFESYYSTPGYYAEHFFMKKGTGYEEVTKINIPYGITKVKPYSCCFRNVKEITIPDSVVEIGERAFSFCVLLEKIDIPSSVKTFGEAVFLGDRNINEMSLSFPNNNYSLATILGRYYMSPDQCAPKTLTINGNTIYENSMTGINEDCNVIISKSVNKIEGFTRCNSIYYEGSLIDYCNIDFKRNDSSLIIYDNFTLNDQKYSNVELKNAPILEIPEGVTSIKKYSFYGVNAVRIVIPSTVISIDNSSFIDYCLVEVLNNSSVFIDINNNYGLEPNYVYTNEEHDETLVIKDDFAFGYLENEELWLLEKYYGCSSTVSLPEYFEANGTNITKYHVKDNAFFSNQFLECLIIPSSVEYINSSAFSGCELFVEVYNNSSLNIVSPKDVTSETPEDAIILPCLVVHNNPDESTSIVHYNDFMCVYDGDKMVIYKYLGQEKNISLISIPPFVKKNGINYYNLSLYNGIFSRCEKVENLIVPNSVSKIEIGAFTNVEMVLYEGSRTEFNQLIGDSWYDSSTIAYYMETNPYNYQGEEYYMYRYWRYDSENNPRIWLPSD